ncbi:MAG TPA: glycosyltransferase family 39 protein [Thermoanaerobaculia bacterium]|nr:glycosyltransferase family 39 protein [Thermoanaerobaculia bacterium]
MSPRAERRRAARQRAGRKGASGAAAVRGRWSFLAGDLGVAVALTLLAWAHRAAFLFSNRDWSWPFTVFYEGDSEAFYRYARALLAGRLYDEGLPFHPPGFAWLLAVLHTLVGAGGARDAVPHLAVRLLLALAAAAAVGLLYLLARPYLGRGVALAGAALTLYHFGSYVLSVAPVSEGPYLTLLLLCLLLWTRTMEHPLAAPDAAGGKRLWAPLVLGLLLGLLALTRAEGALIALLLVGIGLWGWLRGRATPVPRPRLAPWGLVIFGWLLVVAPWTARNALRLAEFNERHAGRLAEPLPLVVPLTLYGPVALALGNHPDSDGTFSPAPLTGAGGAALDLEDPRHLAFVLHGHRMAWRWARAAPGAAARRVLAKWRLSLDAWRLGWTQWNWPWGLAGVRRPVDVFVPTSGASRLGLWLGPALALLGLLACLRAGGPPRRWGLLVLLLTLLWGVVVGLSFGYVRQGLLLLPFWWTLVAAAAAEGLRRAGRWRLPPRLLAAAAAALLLLELLGAAGDRNFTATGAAVSAGGTLNRDATIHLEPLPRR